MIYWVGQLGQWWWDPWKLCDRIFHSCDMIIWGLWFKNWLYCQCYCSLWVILCSSHVALLKLNFTCNPSFIFKKCWESVIFMFRNFQKVSNQSDQKWCWKRRKGKDKKKKKKKKRRRKLCQKIETKEEGKKSGDIEHGCMLWQ